MSTKIYYGYRYKGNIKAGSAFAELIYAFSLFKEGMRKIAAERALHFLKDCTHDINRLFLDIHIHKETRLHVLDILHDCGLDNLSIIAYFRDEHVLITLHGGSRLIEDLTKLELFQKLFDYYGYWDNTDPDENCSEQEWEQRALDWDFLDVPRNDGLEYTLISKLEINPMILEQYYREVYESKGVN